MPIGLSHPSKITGTDMATKFEKILDKIRDGGAKSEKNLNEALTLLPLRIILEMSEDEIAQYVKNFHESNRKIFLNATRKI